jgi:hypothetical protein
MAQRPCVSGCSAFSAKVLVMSCIPQSGGCERAATDELIAHLNSVEGGHYVHRACLDQIDRTGPQPECLYANVDDGRFLVVERKSISWPESYAHDHSKDHELADVISQGIAGTQFRNRYVLRMPRTAGLSRVDIKRLGEYIAQAINLRYDALRLGEFLPIQFLGYGFRFEIQPFEEREDDGPVHGVLFSWSWDHSWLGPDDFAKDLRKQLEKIYAACIRKFSGYSEARRFLMLDPHGEIQFMGARSWNEIFKLLPPPPEIDEIWIGSSGSNDWGEEEWIIDKAYGAGLEFPLQPTILIEE